MGFKASENRVIGLTGNVACGKSTVARLLVGLGVPVIDADAVAREVSAAGTATSAEIARVFGTTDRARLRELVFADPARRAALEAILHPAIRARSQELIQAEFERGAPLIVYEATLLVEAGRVNDFDGLLVVTCPPEAQLTRLLARDATVTKELAQSIIATQMPQAEKARHANWTIANDGSPEELAARTRSWLFSLDVGKLAP